MKCRDCPYFEPVFHVILPPELQGCGECKKTSKIVMPWFECELERNTLRRTLNSPLARAGLARPRAKKSAVVSRSCVPASPRLGLGER